MPLIPAPARPINGGPLNVAPIKIGDWRYEPKFNGFNTLLNLKTGMVANRHREPLDEHVAKELRWAVEPLRQYLPDRTWVNAEGLQRRHKIAQGTVVVFDVLPESPLDETPYVIRREQMSRIPLAPLDPKMWSPKSLYLTPSFDNGLALWAQLLLHNTENFYEGVVAKLASSRYPLQYAEKDFPFWVKHRYSHIR